MNNAQMAAGLSVFYEYFVDMRYFNFNKFIILGVLI